MALELRHFRNFLEAAKTEHFGRAAEHAGLAQPSLSRSIQELERLVGASLFDRVGRGVRLTAAGRALQADAARLLDEAQAALDRARRLAKGEAGTLRVGFVESAIWGGAVPAAFGQFRKRYPDVALEAVPESSLDQRKSILDGRLDCGFVYGQAEAPESEAFVRLAVRSDSVFAALPQGHRLAARARIELGDLAQEPFVLFPRAVAPLYWDRLTRACAAAGFAPHIVQEGSNDSVMLSLVAAGIGVSLVNSVARWRKPEGVALVALSKSDLELPLDMIWLAAARNPALHHFVATMRGRKTNAA